MRKKISQLLTSLMVLAMLVPAAYAEDTAMQTGVTNLVTEIGTYPALIISIGVATLSVVLAVRAFSWIKSAIK